VSFKELEHVGGPDGRVLEILPIMLEVSDALLGHFKVETKSF